MKSQNQGPTCRSLATIATTIALSLCPWQLTLAQPKFQFPQPLFENLALSPHFDDDPIVLRGISGGEVTAQSVAGRATTETGPCLGFIDREPDHIVTLNEFFQYLRLQVQSSQDTTLVITGPGGTWCNDDYGRDKNPGIAGQWLAGTYKIWIGSYTDDRYHPYLLHLSEVQ